VIRKTLAAVAICAGTGVAGCSGAVHQLPTITERQLGLAQTEVGASGGPPTRHAVSDEEARDVMNSALRRIRPSADQVCREMNVGVCVWHFRRSPSGSVNAGAGANGLIEVNQGIVEYAANEEEVAMVIAHEIGHQSANHMAHTQRNQMAGAIAGAILLGAVGAIATKGHRDGAYVTRVAAETGAKTGGAIGRISFSKEQEREADYLAAVILYRAGLDLDKARGFQVTMARYSRKKETGVLDTHPAGPERLAAWDRAVEEIRASKGRLPQRTQ
jgi:predicted Zn-dependent protease